MVLPAKLVRKYDYEYYYDHLPHWARLAEKYKCAIVMVHHARKDNGQAHPNPLQSILGSTAITGACDTILVIQKSDDGQAYTLDFILFRAPFRKLSITLNKSPNAIPAPRVYSFSSLQLEQCVT